MKSKWLRYALLILVGSYSLTILRDIALNSDKLQWDFRTYYYAVLAFKKGLDPYYLSSLGEVAGRSIGFPFAYPPYALVILGPMSFLSYEAAYQFYLVLKVIAFSGLIYLWSHFFLEEKVSPLFIAFCIFGFGGATIIDFNAGNISVVEQFFLWLGFIALLKKRPWVFALSIGFISLFKLLPFLFIFLVFAIRGKHRNRVFLITVIVFLGIQLISLLAFPDLSRSYFSVATQLDSRGINNPATLALFRDIRDLLILRGFNIPLILPTALFALTSLIVLVVTTHTIFQNRTIEPRVILLLSSMAFPLIVPRFKDYSYILLLLPSYYFVTRKLKNLNPIWLIVLLVLSSRFFLPFGLSADATKLFWEYYPLLAVTALWLVWIISIKKDKSHKIITEEKRHNTFQR